VAGLEGDNMSEKAIERAVTSLLDVVEEIAWKVGDADWAQVVTDTFEKHRKEIRGESVNWLGCSWPNGGQ
jgi:hypothetical protein